VNILDKLIYWTKDDTPAQFVGNVLDDREVDLNSERVETAHRVIQECLTNQKEELTRVCLPLLKKLDRLVVELPISGDRSALPETLRKTIDEAIKTLNQQSPFDPPSPIFNLITGYLPCYERAQVHAELANESPNEIAKKIRYMNEREIEALGDRVVHTFLNSANSQLINSTLLRFMSLLANESPAVIAKKTHKNEQEIEALRGRIVHTFLNSANSELVNSALIRFMSQYLREFFLYATLDQQDYFFVYVRRKIAPFLQDVLLVFFNVFVKSLPLEMTQLSLKWEKGQKREDRNDFSFLRDRLKNLKVLRLGGASKENLEACLSVVNQGLESLQQLHLSDCVLDWKSYEDLRTLMSSVRMKGVAVLNFKGTAIDHSIVHALVNNPLAEDLQDLDLEDIDDWDLTAGELGKNKCLVNLKKLNLSGYQTLSDSGVIAIVKNPSMANLRLLNISYTWESFGGDSTITDLAVVIIAHSPYMKNLEELDLSGMCRLTDASVLAIINSPYLKKLKRVKLYECPRISADAMWQLNQFLANNQGKEEEFIPQNQSSALMPYRQSEEQGFRSLGQTVDHLFEISGLRSDDSTPLSRTLLI